MNETIMNYPGFQNLPKGIKQMLLISEAHFFDQPLSHPNEQKGMAQEMRTKGGFHILMTSLLKSGRRCVVMSTHVLRHASRFWGSRGVDCSMDRPCHTVLLPSWFDAGQGKADDPMPLAQKEETMWVDSF
jgi:hypothetical protein